MRETGNHGVTDDMPEDYTYSNEFVTTIALMYNAQAATKERRKT